MPLPVAEDAPLMQFCRLLDHLPGGRHQSRRRACEIGDSLASSMLQREEGVLTAPPHDRVMQTERPRRPPAERTPE